MGRYEDIINLPHHTSSKRAYMSMVDRAAQFSPFAALTGYEEAVREEGRLTDIKFELTDEQIDNINKKLQYLRKNIKSYPQVLLTYFQKDLKKQGGEYITLKCTVKRIDDYEKFLLTTDGQKICIDDIFTIDCDFFKE